jgi:Ser/Thr protein kinase RdoA (MazF antagonist)
MDNLNKTQAAPLLTAENLKFEPPTFSKARLVEIAQRFFGLKGTLKALDGERDQNSHIITDDGRQFVLKISGATEDKGVVDFQVMALEHIAKRDDGLPVPRLVPGKNKEIVQRVYENGDCYQVRLMTFLPGIPHEDGKRPSLEGMKNIGVFLARLNQALSGFSHPAENSFMAWDIGNGLIFNQQLQEQLPDEIRLLIEPLLEHLEYEVYPKLNSLRNQVIHQDAHGGNLLRTDRDSEDVSGIIDFGDLIHGPLVCDIAVCLAHFVQETDDFQAVCSALCQGFDSVTPLQVEELDLLLDLVIARLILNVQLFEFHLSNVTNPPAYIEEELPGLYETLIKLATINRNSFSRSLQSNCKTHCL